jgi:hypothetical protein
MKFARPNMTGGERGAPLEPHDFPISFLLISEFCGRFFLKNDAFMRSQLNCNQRLGHAVNSAFSGAGLKQCMTTMLKSSYPRLGTIFYVSRWLADGDIGARDRVAFILGCLALFGELSYATSHSAPTVGSLYLASCVVVMLGFGAWPLMKWLAMRRLDGAVLFARKQFFNT